MVIEIIVLVSYGVRQGSLHGPNLVQHLYKRRCILSILQPSSLRRRPNPHSPSCISFRIYMPHRSIIRSSRGSPLEVPPKFEHQPSTFRLHMPKGRPRPRPPLVGKKNKVTLNLSKCTQAHHRIAPSLEPPSFIAERYRRTTSCAHPLPGLLTIVSIFAAHTRRHFQGKAASGLHYQDLKRSLPRRAKSLVQSTSPAYPQILQVGLGSGIGAAFRLS